MLSLNSALLNPKNARFFLQKSAKKVINKNTLGYVCPNGCINFQSPEAAMNYAKNTVLQALHCPRPYEKAVLVSDRRVLSQSIGTAEHVEIGSIPDNIKSKVKIIHGHPDILGTGKTTPVSIQDYSVFSSNKAFSEIIAYNSKGEYSKLKRIESPKELSVIQPNVTKDNSTFFNISNFKKCTKNPLANKSSDSFRGKIIKNIIESSSDKKPFINDFIEYYSLNDEAKKLVPAYKKALLNLLTPEQRLAAQQALKSKDTKKAIDLMNNAIKTNEKLPQTIHSFWKSALNHTNIEYSTNFSNLI